MNLLELTGPEFLRVYASLLLGTSAVSLVARWLLRLPTGETGANTPSDLSPYAAAYLRSGEELAMNAAIASLVVNECITAPKNESPGSPPELDARVDELPGSAHDLERVLHHHLAAKGPISVTELHISARSVARRLEAPLVKSGLLISSARRKFAVLAPLLFVGDLFALGIVRLSIALDRDEAVTLLVVLLVATLIVLAAFAQKHDRRTKLGDEMVKRLRDANAALVLTRKTAIQQPTGDDAAWAVGLWSAPIVAAPDGGNPAGPP